MRIWDFPVDMLCNTHLKAEHSELHCIWSVIVNGKKGYSRHPETIRWKACLKALYVRHMQQTAEMLRRGMNHKSILDEREAAGFWYVQESVDSLGEQFRRLAVKKKEGRCSHKPCIDRLKEAGYA